MITRGQKVRLGVFLAVSTGLLVGTMVVLAGLELAEERDVYPVRFEGSVSGLELGAQVKYNGVRVGSVSDIRIDREDVSKVVVELTLAHDTPIKEDTRAMLVSAGITGLKFVELTQGSNTARMRKPGEEIPAGESILDKLTGQAEAIGQKAELLLNNLNKVLDEDNRDRLSRMIESTDDLTSTAAQMLDENRDNLRAVTSSMAELASGLNATLARVDEESVAALQALRVAAEGMDGVVDKRKVDRILANVERLTAALNKTLGELDMPGIARSVGGVAGRAERLMGNLDVTVLRSREDIFATLGYLLEGMENFSEFARSVRENPSLLLRGPQEEERVR